MERLSIEGKGLEAIIRDTSKDIPAPRENADEAQVEALKKEASLYKGKIEKLRSRLTRQEGKASSLENEMERLKKIFTDEIPQSEDPELVIETFREKAEEFDRKKNLLDAFYLYRRIIRMDQQNVNALYQLATIYYSADFPSKAAELLRAILEIQPDHAGAAESLEEIEREL
ncbi:hypothetical protein MNBD_NITROSPINAE04-1310 [hydrothermal vent metagenome]|uniref:Uncharacterized protein n=1 Tax=hydrothermal vent metagenome TaxID=652676 RepID=A0A3B1CA63_9ZZZZ